MRFFELKSTCAATGDSGIDRILESNDQSFGHLSIPGLTYFGRFAKISSKVLMLRVFLPFFSFDILKSRFIRFHPIVNTRHCVSLLQMDTKGSSQAV
jgi:hypothetical protein